MMGEPTLTVSSTHPDVLSLKKELDLIQNENILLLSKLQDAHSQSAALSNENDFFKKKYTAIQQETAANGSMYTRMETQLYQYEVELEALRQERHAFQRSCRDTEKKLEQEVFGLIRAVALTATFEKERSVFEEKIKQLSGQVKSLQKLKSSAPLSRSNTRESVGEADVSKALDNTALLKESTILSKTIKSQDRLIAELREEIEKVVSVQQRLETASSHIGYNPD
ncbi:hypothetical protein K493DRAFT_301242 [Basidiobolus meristosporus CBS 931.73]|uniref:Uncharacterized protein n=1 Tax=Basidiobolus meristosporus CBS 931.73 TaxID=1314790 RepID=A0A1Y1YCU7_9FUNG|nr:hypothetical protein K493DRAFT_301242 [Basidiobolus meristosporus CBS 931.73]|eukprot:ORX95807.1 hypothetical protein K493DRAFT_301242 [Basidiobolus meristosporus CBS 931.73]